MLPFEMGLYPIPLRHLYGALPHTPAEGRLQAIRLANAGPWPPVFVRRTRAGPTLAATPAFRPAAQGNVRQKTPEWEDGIGGVFRTVRRRLYGYPRRTLLRAKLRGSTCRRLRPTTTGPDVTCGR